MITVNKQLLSGTAGDIRATVEDLASGQDHHEYLTGTWFRELAVTLALRDGLAVSAVSYDDATVHELEVSLAAAPHCDPIVIDRSQPGDHCQITLERWLPISGEPGIEDAVNTIYSILTASVGPEAVRTAGTTYEGAVSRRMPEIA